jgi:hypothetical protein
MWKIGAREFLKSEGLEFTDENWLKLQNFSENTLKEQLSTCFVRVSNSGDEKKKDTGLNVSAVAALTGMLIHENMPAPYEVTRGKLDECNFRNSFEALVQSKLNMVPVAQSCWDWMDSQNRANLIQMVSGKIRKLMFQDCPVPMNIKPNFCVVSEVGELLTEIQKLNPDVIVVDVV